MNCSKRLPMALFLMLRAHDKHHMVYVVCDGVRIGACQYCTYQSEDGKCFILDFWVFPPYRGQGVGHECFQALETYTRGGGALYYELNSATQTAHGFWQHLGFADNGLDEEGKLLMIKGQ